MTASLLAADNCICHITDQYLIWFESLLDRMYRAVLHMGQSLTFCLQTGVSDVILCWFEAFLFSQPGIVSVGPTDSQTGIADEQGGSRPAGQCQ